MTYIFIDESGALGSVQKPNDCFIIGLVIVRNLDLVHKIIVMVDEYRHKAGYSSDFELHFHQNSDKQKRGFLAFIRKLDLEHHTIVFKKNEGADYGDVAVSICDFCEDIDDKVKIIMDSNPHLRSELRKEISKRKIGIKTRETRSSSNNIIQIADYVAGVAHKECSSRKAEVNRYKA